MLLFKLSFEIPLQLNTDCRFHLECSLLIAIGIACTEKTGLFNAVYIGVLKVEWW